jgi:hypothetical protein
MNPNSLMTLLGIKLSLIVAGLCGGLVSLAFIANLTLKQAALAVLVGWLGAIYLTPMFVSLFNIPPAYENGCAFIMGFSAMSAIPLIKKYLLSRVASKFSQDKDATP